MKSSIHKEIRFVLQMRALNLKVGLGLVYFFTHQQKCDWPIPNAIYQVVCARCVSASVPKHSLFGAMQVFNQTDDQRNVASN